MLMTWRIKHRTQKIRESEERRLSWCKVVGSLSRNVFGCEMRNCVALFLSCELRKKVCETMRERKMLTTNASSLDWDCLTLRRKNP